MLIFFSTEGKLRKIEEKDNGEKRTGGKEGKEVKGRGGGKRRKETDMYVVNVFPQITTIRTKCYHFCFWFFLRFESGYNIVG